MKQSRGYELLSPEDQEQHDRLMGWFRAKRESERTVQAEIGAQAAEQIARVSDRWRPIIEPAAEEYRAARWPSLAIQAESESDNRPVPPPHMPYND